MHEATNFGLYRFESCVGVHLKSKCNHGHLFTPENTYIKPGTNRRNCKICLARNLKRYRERNREYYREHSKKYKINTKYNLSMEEYNSMLKNQSYKCANPCCDTIFDSSNLPHIDHDHSCCDSITSCGKCVRGILCGKCNRTLGAVNDNTSILHGLIEYIESWKKFTKHQMEQEFS